MTADPMTADLQPPPRWTRYVAVGDSFTEGLWDIDPIDHTQCRGWADMLAARLSSRREAAGRPPLEYANLAIRGRLLGPILRDQVPMALALQPDLVSLVGGGNDMLRPNADIDAMAGRLEETVAALRAAGADVLLGTGVDPVASPIVRRTRSRVGVYNCHIWSIARRHDARVLDLWGMRSLRDWRLWAPDRIHLTTEGHARVAQAALVALRLPPDDAAWDDSLAPLPPVPRSERARADAAWLRGYVYPWATRRLRGTSSGDVRSAKRPEPRPVDAERRAAQASRAGASGPASTGPGAAGPGATEAGAESVR